MTSFIIFMLLCQDVRSESPKTPFELYNQDSFLLGTYAERVDYDNIEEYLRGFFNWRRGEIARLIREMQASGKRYQEGTKLTEDGILEIDGSRTKYLISPSGPISMLNLQLFSEAFEVIEKRLRDRGMREVDIEHLKDHFVKLGPYDDYRREAVDAFMEAHPRVMNPKREIISKQEYGKFLQKLNFYTRHTASEEYAIAFFSGLKPRNVAIIICYLEEKILDGWGQQTNIPGPPSSTDLDYTYKHYKEFLEKKKLITK
ncbi:MAG: hypothetical protein QNK37_23225 [Acidobacteriota bacterium]|nr:hypothetical protein [Acidobacteriota bacterium]